MAESILICRHNKNGTGYCECLGEYCVEGPCKAEELIEYAPVQHGRWESTGALVGLMNFEYFYRCTACGRRGGDTKTDYCPHCGALMDKEK